MLVVVAATMASAASTADWSPREGGELVGRSAPEIEGVEWLSGGPVSVAQARADGSVLLMRFWLTECPYCAASAPALNEMHQRYAERGLVVVGIHHPKSERARNPDFVRAAAKDLGFDFAVGIDDEWKTVRAYGVGTAFRSFTSVSFLIDKTGVIRWVHDGGEFHRGGGQGHERCNAALESLERALGPLL